MMVNDMNKKKQLVIVKGAGDLASGIAYRLYKCGLEVIMTELKEPLVVRRTVSFAAAVYEGTATIEGVSACLADTVEQAVEFLKKGVIPVIIDPQADVVRFLRPAVVVDARMAKRNLGTTINDASMVIGIGPGFTTGIDAHVVVETCRGHNLGRAIYNGCATPNTGVPGAIDGHTWNRLLRAPVSGVVTPVCSIGDMVNQGDVVAFVEKFPVQAAITGVVRGMIKEGIWVTIGTKIGDIDPRQEAECNTISDKSLAIGGGVLEAVFHFLTFSV